MFCLFVRCGCSTDSAWTSCLRAKAKASTLAGNQYYSRRNGSLVPVDVRAQRGGELLGDINDGVPFGVEAVISYLAAKEIEFTAVRIIMSGRMAGISGDIIRERLREAYV